MEKQKIVFVFGLFLLISACKKEETIPTVYLTPLEESFLNFPVNNVAVFGNYLTPPVIQYNPSTLGIQRNFSNIYQGSDTEYESLSIYYEKEWLYPYYSGPPLDMRISVRNNKLIVKFHMFVMWSDEYSTYELDLQPAQPAFETFAFKDRVFNDVYMLENTDPSYFFNPGDVYFNKEFGIVAFYHDNEFIYLKN